MQRPSLTSYLSLPSHSCPPLTPVSINVDVTLADWLALLSTLAAFPVSRHHLSSLANTHSSNLNPWQQDLSPCRRRPQRIPHIETAGEDLFGAWSWPRSGWLAGERWFCHDPSLWNRLPTTAPKIPFRGSIYCGHCITIYFGVCEPSLQLPMDWVCPIEINTEPRKRIYHCWPVSN